MKHDVVYCDRTDGKRVYLVVRRLTFQHILIAMLLVPQVHAFLPSNKNSKGIGSYIHRKSSCSHRKIGNGAIGNDGRGDGNNNILSLSEIDDRYGERIIGSPLNTTELENEIVSSSRKSIITTISTTGTTTIRGGGKLTKEKPDLFTSTTSYWQTTINTVTHTLTEPFRLLQRRVFNMMKSKERTEEDEMIQQIRTMKVRSVIVPNTTVLPKDVIDIAAKRTSLLGNPLKTEYVQDFAQSIKRWYVRQGYILHSVTGATLQPTTATVEITVQEPIHHTIPINITYYREMIIDPDTGDITTYRQYKEKHVRRQSFGLQEKIDKRQLNVTYVPTLKLGHVRPSKIAKALHMVPGQPFQWDPMKWDIIQKSGLFSNVLQITPRTVVGGNNAVQLQIVATEAPTKHLEYGIGKNLYHNGWEGELDFEHMNILGGGETLGINLRRGTTTDNTQQPSIRCRFSTGRLQETGGYDIEAFNECINGRSSDGAKTRKRQKIKAAAVTSTNDENDENNQQIASTKNGDPNDSATSDSLVFDRRGATIRIKNPIDPNTIRHSVFSASMERTSSSSSSSPSGTFETIGSTTMEVGPFLKELPMNARSNFDLSITTGARFGSKRHESLLFATTRPTSLDEDINTDPNDETLIGASSSMLSSSSNGIIPYATFSATTRQIFPLLSGKNTNRNRFRRRSQSLITTMNAGNENNNLSVSGGSMNDPLNLQQQERSGIINNSDNEVGRPLLLALKHTIIVSSDTIPQHVGKAIATSTNVRGYAITDQSLVATALRGTTELRVPLYLPSIIPNEKIQQFFEQDANIVIYSDWLVSMKNHRNNDDLTTATSNDKNNNSMFNRKSCIGIGLRKTIQGIPLQYDVTCSNEGNLKAMFGLGRDFIF